MEHLLNADGTRNRQYRPYILGEETTYETSGYNPFVPVDYGLYSGPQPIYRSARGDVIMTTNNLKVGDSLVGKKPILHPVHPSRHYSYGRYKLLGEQ